MPIPQRPSRFPRLTARILALATLLFLVGPTSNASANEETYRPILTQALGETAIQPFAYLGSQTEWVSALPLENNLGRVNANLAVDLVARFGIRFHTMTALDPAILALQLEGDVPTGTLTPSLPFPNQGLPHSAPVGFRLRRAGFKLGYQDIVHVSAGISTPQWGLGLVYNDGQEGWQPGQIHFRTPREGDRSLRALVGTGKLTPAKLQLGLGWEMPMEPGSALELQSVHNLMLSATVEPLRDVPMGLLLNLRLGSGREQLGLGTWLADVFAKIRIPVGFLHLAVGLEMAIEGGHAEDHFAGNLRYAGILRTQLGSRTWGVGLDTLFASQERSDTPGFRIDRNLPLGWLMFPYMSRIHTALVATQTDGVVRPQSNVQNVLGGQLKGRWRPLAGFEVIGGTLLALRPTGTLGQADWSVIGTELNLGIRWRGLFARTECILGFDGGLVLPATYLATKEPTYGARFIFEYRL